MHLPPKQSDSERKVAGQKRTGKEVCSGGEESSEDEDQIWNEMDTIHEKKSNQIKLICIVHTYQLDFITLIFDLTCSRITKDYLPIEDRFVIFVMSSLNVGFGMH